MFKVCQVRAFKECDLKSLGEYGYSSDVVYNISSKAELLTKGIQFSVLPEKKRDKFVYKWPVEGFEEAFFKRQVAEGEALGLYQTNSEALIGLAVGRVVAWNKTLHMNLLHVAASHRGLGGGRLLLEALEQKAANLGLSAMTLEVQNTNGHAILFYEHCGYEITGFDRGKYEGSATGDAQVAVFMRKRL